MNSAHTDWKVGYEVIMESLYRPEVYPGIGKDSR